MLGNRELGKCAMGPAQQKIYIILARLDWRGLKSCFKDFGPLFFGFCTARQAIQKAVLFPTQK